MNRVKIILPQFKRDIEEYHEYVDELTNLPGIREVIVFPNVILKKKYIEADYKCSVPSSLAIISTDDAVYPQLRSRGIGCGMIVFRTGLIASNENIEKFEKILKKILSTKSKNKIYQRIRPGKWIEGRYGFGEKEWPEILNTGIREYLVSKLGVHKADTAAEFFEARGNHLVRPAQYDEYYSDYWLNGKSYDIRSGLIGTIFGGNHFLELQRAESLNGGDDISGETYLKNNELVIMAHLCGDKLENILRKDIVEKVIHLDYYRPINKDEVLYEVIKESVALLKNFGALSRAALFARIRDAIEKILSPDIAESLAPISECTHNDIDFSHTSGSIIYRHNLARLYAERLTIVSGRADHPSYLVSPGVSSRQTWDSIDHGIGEYLHNKVDSDIHTKKVMQSRYLSWTFKESLLPHFKTSAGDDLLKAYREAGILKDIIKLVPLVSIHG